MQSREYVELVTGQMRCKKAQKMVADELQNHIDDQIETYTASGMDRDKAEAEAVRSMGDPIEVGTDMDRIHRPKVDYKLLGIVVVISIFGILIQILCLSSIKDMNTSLIENLIYIFGYFSIGLIGMIIMMFLDYSILGRYLLSIYVGLMLVLLLASQMNPDIFLVSDFTNALFLLLTPVYAAFVYRLRNFGYKGLVFSVLLLGFTSLVYVNNYTYNTFDSIDLFFIGMIVLSFAVMKGWFSVNRKRSLLTLWLMWLVPLAAIVIGIFSGLIGSDYQRDRLLAFIHPTGTESDGAYQIMYMREMLSKLKLFGAFVDFSDVGLLRNGSSYDFGYLLCRFGIIGGIVLISSIGLLIAVMMNGIFKQSNRLGTLVGLSCILALCLPTLRSILISLTVIPPANAALPFFSVSGKGTIGIYLLIGIYLSVYRNSNIVSEKNMKPKYRIVMEKNQ